MITLKADDLPRFMSCNGSLQIPQVEPFQPDNTMRNEGDAWHWLIEQVFNKRFGTDELVDRPAFNGVYITEEMIEHALLCLNDIKHVGKVEVITSYGDGVHYQINGRADYIDFTDCHLTIGDFKYGWSIVEPEKNWTLLSHAFGWLFANPTAKDNVTQVTLRIWQPRPHHPLGKVRSVTYSIAEIWEFWNIFSNKLIKPEDILNTGNHCKHCYSMINCPAARASSMNAIDVSEKPYVSSVDDSSLALLLQQYERAIKILEENKKAATEYALHRIKQGNIIPGYTVEKELTNKQWKQGITVESAALLTGKQLAKKQLITPSQAVKAGVPQEVVDSLCERREKGVKLVRMDANTAVKKMFKSILTKEK